jgi:hypothetical protein
LRIQTYKTDNLSSLDKQEKVLSQFAALAPNNRFCKLEFLSCNYCLTEKVKFKMLTEKWKFSAKLSFAPLYTFSRTHRQIPSRHLETIKFLSRSYALLSFSSKCFLLWICTLAKIWSCFELVLTNCHQR